MIKRRLGISFACLAALTSVAYAEDVDLSPYVKNGAAADAKTLIDKIAGVYKTSFENAYFDGGSYKSEDVMEIVKVSDTKAYFKTRLNFYNGHECSVFGAMEYKAVGGFVLQIPENDPMQGKCYLTVKLVGDKVTLIDPNSACREYTCGARGGYDQTAFPLSKKREIKYMDRLMKSDDYRKSMGIAPTSN